MKSAPVPNARPAQARARGHSDIRLLRLLLAEVRRYWGGTTWLILGFQPGWFIDMRLDLAGRWIGEFQRAATARFGDRPPAWLKRYDPAYYAQWARRTREFAEWLGLGLRWLPAVCEGFEAVASDLLGLRRTAIHGELYPSNVILHKDAAVPVDWESAAFGAGETDLATLTDGWSAAHVDECLREYVAARWPEGIPGEFEAGFDAARIYLDFRWLGESPAQLAEPESRRVPEGPVGARRAPGGDIE